MTTVDALITRDLDALRRIARAIADELAGKWPTRDYSAEAIFARARILLDDHGDKSPQELRALAETLLIGGAHDNGRLAQLVRHGIGFPSYPLLAATLYAAWHGGKFGFQFLPDPASLPLEDYEIEVQELLEIFEMISSDPREILVNSEGERDLDFYESLPDRLTIYRGCSGISAEQTAAGICWSLRRDIAEWFATRGAEVTREGAPVLVSARIGRDDIVLARAMEYEIVARPPRFRTLKCRSRKRPDDLTWGETTGG